MNRSILESEQVTKHIHEWINLMFGVCMSEERANENFNVYNPLIYAKSSNSQEDTFLNKSEMYRCVVFSKGSVPNQVFFEELKQNQCKEDNAESKFFEIFENEESLLVCSGDTTFFSADKKGNIRIYETNLKTQNACVKAENNLGFEIDESCKVEYVNNSYFVANLSSRICALVDEDGNVKILSNRAKTFCINGNAFSIANMNGTIQIGEKMISITHGSVLHYSFSFKHNILVLLTDDGFLSVYSLRKFRFISSHFIGLDTNVQSILITCTFGIIVVVDEREISLFTVNGFFIKKETIPSSIACCCAYSVSNIHMSNELLELNGVDRVCCYSLSSKAVCVFDVMFPSKWKKILTMEGAVTSMRYDSENRAVSITSRNGMNYILPSKLL